MNEFTFKAEKNTNNEIVFTQDSIFYDDGSVEIDRKEFYNIVNYTINIDADFQENIPDDVFEDYIDSMIEGNDSVIELSREEYLEAKNFEV